MSIKYKIDDAKKNKNLINDEIKLSRVKSKGGHGNGGRKSSKSKAPAWFKEFSDNINKKFDRQDKRFDKLEKEVANLRNDFNRVIKLNDLKH